jgi:hypothetical protein
MIKITLPNTYLINNHPISNLSTLISGSLPSHHRIWSNSTKKALHVPSLVDSFNNEHYSKILICPIQWNITQLNDSIFHFPNLQEYSSSETFNASLKVIFYEKSIHSKQEIFSVIILDEKMNQSQELQNLFNLESSMFLCGQLESAEDCLQTDFQIRINSDTKSFNKNYQTLVSLEDFSRSILSYLEKPIPHPMVGKNFSAIFKNKGIKDDENIRKWILQEFENGDKRLITEKCVLQIPKDKEKRDNAALYDRIKDPELTKNVWHNEQYKIQKEQLLLQFLWAQLQKESVPMHRIAGA